MVTVFVEGGGDTRELKSRCRKGFSEFFRHAGLKNRMPRVVACGGRGNAYDKFCRSLDIPVDGHVAILLVDSEEQVSQEVGPWSHLRKRDGWQKPPGATDDQAQLMVQCMEAWFLADRECLAKVFGKDFRAKALPGSKDIEGIAKEDVMAGLKKATRRGGKLYHKGRHSFVLLAKIDPKKVADASPHVKRLLDCLDRVSCAT